MASTDTSALMRLAGLTDAPISDPWSTNTHLLAGRPARRQGRAPWLLTTAVAFVTAAAGGLYIGMRWLAAPEAAQVAAPAAEPTAAVVAPEPTPVAEPPVVEPLVVQLDPAPAPAPAPPEPPAARSRSHAARGAGAGTLMLGAKPPCEIVIDGRPTGLYTPQRSLTLAAGRHRITLVNREHQLEVELTAEIEAGETTRIVKDLSDRLPAAAEPAP